MINTPIPADLPLPLPVPMWFLQFGIVALFLLHILFVNLMVGGAILTITFEIAGLVKPKYDQLAQSIAHTITANKSLAVVLGVGPLLVINLLYTLYFYSANALTGVAWGMVIPGVTMAFLLSYLHKFSWDRMRNHKILHIAIGALYLLIFLTIPLIFLSNINLMLFPDRWADVHGFLSALQLQNVLPRYFHFLLACLAVTGLFLVVYLTRRGYPTEEKLPDFERPELRRMFYGLAFGATLGQAIAGPLLLLTLPAPGMSYILLLIILGGVTCAGIFMYLIWKEMNAERTRIGRHFAAIFLLITATVLFMGYGRHFYREVAINRHKEKVSAATTAFVAESVAANIREQTGLGQTFDSPGERVYVTVCASCHALDSVVVGPSIREIAGIYADDTTGIVEWSKAPGKKREGFIQMPAFGNLPESDLYAVAEYMLEMDAAPAGEAGADDTETDTTTGEPDVANGSTAADTEDTGEEAETVQSAADDNSNDTGEDATSSPEDEENTPVEDESVEPETPAGDSDSSNDEEDSETKWSGLEF
jgi:cytochrome c